MMRRDFLKLAMAGAGSSGLGMTGYQKVLVGKKIVVVGAGMAGLAAAREMVAAGAEVVLVEARQRVGGRVWTSKRWADAPVDLGASWIHGVEGNPVHDLARRAGSRMVETSYEREKVLHPDGRPLEERELKELGGMREKLSAMLLRAQEADRDRTIAELVSAHAKGMNAWERRLMDFVVNDSIEQEFGGEAEKMSAYWFDAGKYYGGGDVMFPGGHEQVTGYLSRGLDIRMGQRVTSVSRKGQGVMLKVGDVALQADHAVITVPLGVLKRGTISFDPALPSRKMEAIESLGIGGFRVRETKYLPAIKYGRKSNIMKFRKFPGTDIRPVSEIGFGMWIVSTGWWGNYTEGEALSLMNKALDLGINFFDAADTYGNGKSEELLGKAFEGKRDEIVIATKVGYNFYDHGESRTGQREIPQDFSPDFISRAVDQALRRLRTDHIDLLQLHNIKMEQIDDDALWQRLETLRAEGKVLAYGAALGPAIGWLYEGVECVQKRKPYVLQHIYNLFEQHPGKSIMDAASPSDPTRFLIRVPHSSGMLEGKYTLETKFPPGDHRSHRPRSWLINGVQKVSNIRFLETTDRSLGQASLLWLLHDERIASVFPNIYDEAQLCEFARAPDCPPLAPDELARLEELKADNFGIGPEESKFKGTMERASA